MRGRNASETAKFLSRSGLGAIGLSPAKIDALVQGYLAEAGTFTFSLADHLVTTVQGKEPASKNLAKQPFFKSFLTDPNSDKAVASFYQIQQTANQVAQEFSDMTKSGLSAQAVELMQDEDKRKLMASAPALRRVATSMTAIRKAIEATKNNQNILPDERREMVNKLTAQYNRVAQQGVKLADTLGIR
jgi:septal ring factor EnvC (AmiA/AmiB activator)